MLRTILTADKKQLVLQLPDSFLGKQIEIIAFVVDEFQTKTPVKSKSFTVLNLDTKSFKFNRDEANER